MGENEEVDEDSTSSAEGSHADNGRGPSESGEGLHHQHASGKFISSTIRNLLF